MSKPMHDRNAICNMYDVNWNVEPFMIRTTHWIRVTEDEIEMAKWFSSLDQLGYEKWTALEERRCPVVRFRSVVCYRVSEPSHTSVSSIWWTHNSQTIIVAHLEMSFQRCRCNLKEMRCHQMECAAAPSQQSRMLNRDHHSRYQNHQCFAITHFVSVQQIRCCVV